MPTSPIDCTLCLSYYGKDGVVRLYRDITIPFLPYEDLVLDLEEDNEFIVEEISFSLIENRFFLYEKVGELPGEEDSCGCEPDDECCLLSHAVDWLNDKSQWVCTTPMFYVSGQSDEWKALSESLEHQKATIEILKAEFTYEEE